MRDGEIENGVVKRAVLTIMTLSLVAMAKKCREILEPTSMLEYTDDWVILTSNKTPKTAEARLQKATNTVSRYRRKPRVSRKTKIKIRIDTEKITMVKQR
jgi:hypothetical protein